MQAIEEVFWDECDIVKNNRNTAEIKSTRTEQSIVTVLGLKIQSWGSRLKWQYGEHEEFTIMKEANLIKYLLSIFHFHSHHIRQFGS